MKFLSIPCLLIAASSLLVVTPAEACFKKKKKVVAQTVVKDSLQSSYSKFIKKSEKKKGVFTIHKSNNKYYLEIPQTLLDKDLMISSKVSKSSEANVITAGEMLGRPKMISFAKGNDQLLMKSSDLRVDLIAGQEKESKSIHRNYMNPTLEAFKIVEKSPKDSSYVIDVTNFMLSTAGDMGIKGGVMASPAYKLSPNSGLNEILEANAFEKNVNFKCRLAYKVSDSPFEAIVTRSIIILPEKPMKGRLSDPKMNYFPTRRTSFDSNNYMSKNYNYINRWNLQPKPEDLEAYKAGKLVEPQKPIVYYVDDAFPEKLKKYIKQGIEDWQLAFEKVGFKNAIIAKDFPNDSTSFDPEDIRYSCVRYTTVPIANAMGPSWVDPRSGEIIQGSVYLFHDVIKLVHNWMFSQMGAACPDVRKLNFDEPLLGRTMRYIIAHEIGHTLGLMHNMKSSSVYPVDSLRSATFTQKYGTTASIMDYARFNYVAQPGDKGVSFTPPLIGEYDYFAIKVGYKPIFEENEKPIIKKWFDEVKGNKLYVYGPQFMIPIDPSSQTEDLGDDPIKASAYGIKNAKYIMKNLKKWAIENNYEMDDLSERYKAVLGQFNNYFGHVLTMIGGIYLYCPDLDDNQKALVPLSKEKRRAALHFLLNEIKDCPNWMERPEISAKLIDAIDVNYSDMQANYLSRIFGKIPTAMALYGKLDKSYGADKILADMYAFVWKETISGKKLNESSKSMQYAYIKELMSNLGLLKSSPKMPFMFDGITSINDDKYVDSDAATSIPDVREKYATVEYKNACFAQLLKVKSLLSVKQNSGDKATQAHYKFLLHEINNAMKP